MSVCFVFAFGCNTKPDYSVQIKTIDSLQTEVKKNLEAIEKMDTVWMVDFTKKAEYNVKMLKKVYNPDSLDPDEIGMINYYKGYRKLGKKIKGERYKLMIELKKSMKQLADLKTDAENGSLKKEDLDKYLVEENIVTTGLIYQFNEMENTTKEVLERYDSIAPKIEKIVEVYSKIYEESERKKDKSAITIH